MKFLLMLWRPIRAAGIWLEDQQHRRSVYGVAVAAMPLLTGAAIVTDGQAQQILGVLALVAAAGVPGLARRNTPKRARRDDEYGAGELELILLVAILLGVALLLFRVHL